MSTTRAARILIVGNVGGTNVGWALQKAARGAGHEVEYANAREALEAPRWLHWITWHALGHRPARLRRFSADVRDRALRSRPDIVITTGAAPILAADLEQIRSVGVRLANYSTDDPWNPTSRALWFLRALPRYDTVFSPRRSNLDDLRRLGCRRVEFLPFGYDPELFFAEPLPANAADLGADVLFVGGADADRARLVGRIASAGFDVAIIGSFWEPYRETRALTRGQCDPQTIRRVTRASRISLCLVRHSNRDGHVMRSFEAAAIGACMLVEDTAEHHEIFGADGENVMFFSSFEELTAKAHALLADAPERRRLADAAQSRISSGHHTYADRLRVILDALG